MTSPLDAAKYLANEAGIPVNGAYPLTDYGNSERLVELHGKDLRFNHLWKKWLAWEGDRWTINNNGEVMRRAKATAREMYRQAGELATAAAVEPDRDKAQQASSRAEGLLKFARASEAQKALNAMISLAESQPSIPVGPSELDADSWVINCRSGTIALRSSDLKDHVRSDMITKIMPTEYDPDAKCPQWMAFLERIMEGNQGLITFLQRAVGYSLTGDVSAHILFVLHGTGRNGKSTFCNTIMALMGDYATKAPKDLLLLKDKQVHETETSVLYGVRFVAAIETAEGRRMNEVQVKELTGGDPIQTRRMREDFWQFWPTHKLWLATNHRPLISGTDTGFWSRIRLVPFKVTIPLEERDLGLADKLKEEWPGILGWAVQGCLEWQRIGLQEPPEVWEATREYRSQMDVLGDFIRDKCYAESDARIASKDLHDAYQAWARQAGEKQLSKQDLGQRLEERGFTPRKGAKGKRLWVGIGLVVNFDEAEELPPIQGELEDSGVAWVAKVAPDRLSASHGPGSRAVNGESPPPTPPTPPSVSGLCICTDYIEGPVPEEGLPACPDCSHNQFWCPVCYGCRFCHFGGQSDHHE